MTKRPLRSITAVIRQQILKQEMNRAVGRSLAESARPNPDHVFSAQLFDTRSMWKDVVKAAEQSEPKPVEENVYDVFDEPSIDWVSTINKSIVLTQTEKQLLTRVFRSYNPSPFGSEQHHRAHRLAMIASHVYNRHLQLRHNKYLKQSLSIFIVNSYIDAATMLSNHLEITAKENPVFKKEYGIVEYDKNGNFVRALATSCQSMEEIKMRVQELQEESPKSTYTIITSQN